MSEKRTYVFLDGLRGLAALFVVNRHTYEYWHVTFFRSYLAVDIFFILSGFVIASAYDHKLQNGSMSFGQFARVRLIRLYPVYLLSLALCTIIAFHRVFAGASHLTLAQVGASASLALVFLPSMLTGNLALFPLNVPYWSLFFELVANFLYAAIRPLLSTRALISIVAISGLIMAAIALQRGSMDYGMGWKGLSAIGGLFRSIFGIFFGLLLFRKRAEVLAVLKPVSPWLAFFAIAAVLGCPNMDSWNPVIDIFCAAIAFPFLILSATCYKDDRFKKILSVLGSASYPVYVLQIPISELLDSATYGLVGRFAPLSGIGLLIALTALALIIEKLYDLPLRKWLLQQNRRIEHEQRPVLGCPRIDA